MLARIGVQTVNAGGTFCDNQLMNEEWRQLTEVTRVGHGERQQSYEDDVDVAPTHLSLRQRGWMGEARVGLGW